MALYVIGDLHLSFGTDKPMDIFGWGNHSEKIKEYWKENITQNDTVILPGDFSWSMSLEETYKDFEFLNNLPGTKILSKGNHDYWWNSITKMKNFIKKSNFTNIEFLHNNAFLVEDKIIVGTRGWINTWQSDENYKILRRENERLKLSINYGINEFGNDKEIIVFFHYSPIYKENIVPPEIDFSVTMQEYNIKRCYYGHLHGESHREAFEGEKNGIKYNLISSDYLKFKPKKIM